MKITHEFTVSVPPAQAWAVLTDLEAIAPCMPGASLTGFDGETYQGKVRVKLGPVISNFGGTATFAAKDDATHHAVIDAKGKDARGAGNASARITADLRPAGSGTLVSVDTDLTISGKVAQFGSSMIKQVSEKLLGEFTACLESKLATGTLGTPQAGPPQAPETPAPGDVPEPALTDAASEATTPEAGTRAAAQNATPAGTAAEAAGVQRVAVKSAGAAQEEPEPLDLMHVAGGSIAKRVVPIVAVLVVVAVVIYLLVR